MNKIIKVFSKLLRKIRRLLGFIKRLIKRSRRKLSKILGKITKKTHRIYWKYLTINFIIINKIVRKSKNQIIFFSSPSFSDNSRALYNEMLKHELYKKYKFIWVVSNYEKYKNNIPYAKVVKRNTFRSAVCFIKSKYIVASHFPYTFSSKKQEYIQLWHGNIFKQVGKLMNNNKSKLNFRNLSQFTVSGEFHIKPTALANNVDERKIVVTGLPRNDELFDKVNLYYALDIQEKYKKIILWMPTFRKSAVGIFDGKNYKYGLPLMDEHSINELNENLIKNNCLLLIKNHMHSSIDETIKKYSNIRVLKASDFYQDFTLHNLLGNVDALLTDYSSVFVDFLIKDKPIGFVYDDMEDYHKTRGFIVDKPVDYMPGAHLSSLSSLLSFIDDIVNDIDNYQEARKKINSIFNKYTDNQNAVRVLKSIKFID